ncbi:MAG: hypothetical protein CSB33_00185 [Desulfobacterales bacterium]|nr:MAG: hypothetical protein CSB33_00185 [Desulfobacterales bacterium]
MKNFSQKLRSLRFVLPLLFVGLALLFEGMILLYWTQFIEPAIKSEAETAAKAMAQFLSFPLADGLSPHDGAISMEQVTKTMDIALLPTNPVTKEPFFEGIVLYTDPEALSDIPDRLRRIRRGDTSCPDCAVVDIPLYSRYTRELLGIARYSMSMSFYRNLKRDMVRRLLFMALLMLVLIIIVWSFAIMATRPLSVLSKHLTQTQAGDLTPVPELTGLVPTEVLMVKQALNELLYHAREYTMQLDAANTELKNTQSQLVQTGRLASIGELAAGVAHELNQPLMVIRAHAQLLKNNIGRVTDDELTDIAHTMERNTDRMMKIINHLRDFSRQSSTEFHRFDIRPVIEDALSMVAEQLRIHGIAMETRFFPDLPECRGNKYQIEQVLLNLFTNARDAITARYGVSENSAAPGDAEGRICVTACRSRNRKGHIDILVSDNGIGIRPGEAERVFDPFFTTKEVGMGTGLGLSISYGIMETHNGEIVIERSDETGTTFRISLPLADEVTAADDNLPG